MHGIVTKSNTSLEEARIAQAQLLGEDLLLAFSNGTSILLDGEDVKAFALRMPKKLVGAYDDLDEATGTEQND